MYTYEVIVNRMEPANRPPPEQPLTLLIDGIARNHATFSFPTREEATHVTRCSSRLTHMDPIFSRLDCVPVGPKQVGDSCSYITEERGAYDDCGAICCVWPVPVARFVTTTTAFSCLVTPASSACGCN